MQNITSLFLVFVNKNWVYWGVANRLKTQQSSLINKVNNTKVKSRRRILSFAVMKNYRKNFILDD